jgi:peptidoglycan/LPS O-acetylase OafA/YrhL
MMSEIRSQRARPVEGFLPHLDGLRGVAVLLVLLYHARAGVSGGYVGVDVFLVLSGFLITSLLLRESDQGAVSLWGFWSRRARRLLPVSAVVVVFTVFVGLLLLEPQRLSRLSGDVVSVATFSSNFRFLETHGDYLGGLSLPSPLLHFWSLALEEQFYLLWPLLLVPVLRISRRRPYALPVVTASLLFGSLALSVLLTASRPAFSYYLLPTRAWEMFAGALLAACWSPSTRRLDDLVVGLRVRSVIGTVGLGSILAAALLFGSSTVFPGWAATLPVAGTLLVLAAGGSSVSGRLLSSAPLVWLGARSYGAYLWHWPLLVFLAALGWDGSPITRLVVVLLAVLLAAVTFRLVETPVRRSPWLLASSRRSVLAGAGLSLVLVSLGSVLPRDFNPVAGVASRDPRQPAEVPGSVPSSTPATSAPSTIPPGPVGTPARVLLIGDSTLAPLRWFTDGRRSLDALGGEVEFVLEAESCRRVSMRSCVGREGRRPGSAVDVIKERSAAGERFEIVVLMAGYHSTPGEFAVELEEFLRAAADHGAEKVFVLDYRESLAFPIDGSRGELSVFGVFNDVLRDPAVSGVSLPEGVDVVILPWSSFTASADDWFRQDGIHVNLAGALGLGEFVARGVLSHLGSPCAGEEVCSPSTHAVSAAQVLAAYGVEATDTHCYEMGDSREQECREDRLR